MKTKLFVALFSLSSLFADTAAVEEVPPVRNGFKFVSLGVGGALVGFAPFGCWGTLTLGGRSQWGHNGFEASLQYSTLILWFSQVRLNLLYHYYFAPNPTSQVYLGAGVGPGIGLEAASMWHCKSETNFIFSSIVSLGYEYKTEGGSSRFVEAQVSPPLARINSPRFTPALLISYGFGF